MRSVSNVHWKDWCWSWNSNILATWCEELTQLKRPWCWERFKVKGEGDDRGLDGWMASLTQWTWVWENSGSWWWTGRPDMLQSVRSQRVGQDWATELNWTDGQVQHECEILVIKLSYIHYASIMMRHILHVLYYFIIEHSTLSINFISVITFLYTIRYCMFVINGHII